MSVELRAGERAVMDGVGVVEIAELSKTDVTLKQGADVFTVAMRDAPRCLRKLATESEIREALGRGRTASTRSASDRAFEYSSLVDSGTFADRARAFAELHDEPDGFGAMSQYRNRFEVLLAAEIGGSLALTPRAARAMLRKAFDPKVVEGPDRTAELRKHRKLPTLAGYRAVGAIAIEAELCVGESGFSPDARAAWSAPAETGVWYVYEQRESRDEPPTMTLAVHHTALAMLDENAAWKRVATLDIEGATMMIADKDATLDRQFLRERLAARLRSARMPHGARWRWRGRGVGPRHSLARRARHVLKPSGFLHAGARLNQLDELEVDGEELTNTRLS